MRQLLVVTATLQFTGKRRHTAPGGAWLEQLRQRKHARVAAVAMANKLARMAWAIVTKGGSYRVTARPGVPDEIGPCGSARGLTES